MTTTRADWVLVGGPVQPWVDLGLVPIEADGVTRFAFFGTGIEVDASMPSGLSGLALSRDGVGGEARRPDIDGIAVDWRPAAGPTFVEHPLGVRQIDHVVITTDDLARTSGAVADVTGSVLKRVRETDEVRQGFHRLGGLIVEVVEHRRAEPGPAEMWGVVLAVDDLDAVCARLGPDVVGAPRPAVQPGRRITTVRREAGLGCAVALMSPHVG